MIIRELPESLYLRLRMDVDEFEHWVEGIDFWAEVEPTDELSKRCCLLDEDTGKHYIAFFPSTKNVGFFICGDFTSRSRNIKLVIREFSGAEPIKIEFVNGYVEWVK